MTLCMKVYQYAIKIHKIFSFMGLCYNQILSIDLSYVYIIILKCLYWHLTKRKNEIMWEVRHIEEY